MRRSLLFMSGNNPAMLQNSDVFGSDAIIFDLEDAVSITEKDTARTLVSYFLADQKLPIKQEIVIRINGLDTIYYPLDLEMIVSDAIDTIMLPKATVKDVKILDQILTRLEKTRKMTKGIGIIPIIELTKSMLEVEQIASLARVNGILLGAEDLCSDLEVSRTKEGNEIFYARSKVIFACKANKIDAIDTPFTDVNDPVGLKKDTVFAASLGMTSKTAIHPNQISIINEVFMPSSSQINWAKRVLVATKKAKEQGLGVFSLDAKMIDKPIIERAEKIIHKALNYGVISEDEIDE